MSNFESIFWDFLYIEDGKKKKDLRFQRVMNISVKINYSNPNVIYFLRFIRQTMFNDARILKRINVEF